MSRTYYYAPKDHPDYPECPELFRFCELDYTSKLDAIEYMLDERALPVAEDVTAEDVSLDLAEEVAEAGNMLFTNYGIGYHISECIAVSSTSPRAWRMIICKAGEQETHDYPTQADLEVALVKRIDYELILDVPSAIKIEAVEVDAESGVIIDYVDTYNAFLRYEVILTTPGGHPYPAIWFPTRGQAYRAAAMYMASDAYHNRHYGTAMVEQVNFWRNRERITCKMWHRESDD